MVRAIAAAYPEPVNHDQILVAVVEEMIKAMTIAEEAGLLDLVDPLRRVFEEAQRELLLRSHRPSLPS